MYSYFSLAWSFPVPSSRRPSSSASVHSPALYFQFRTTQWNEQRRKCEHTCQLPSTVQWDWRRDRWARNGGARDCWWCSPPFIAPHSHCHWHSSSASHFSHQHPPNFSPTNSSSIGSLQSLFHRVFQQETHNFLHSHHFPLCYLKCTYNIWVC